MKEYIRLGAMVLGYVSGGTLYWVHQNHIGQPMQVASQNGDLQWWTRYKPFGETRSGATGGSVPIYLRYPGQYQDWETGLAYNMARDYDGVLGRYAQSDPIGLAGGWNTYAYAGGNPVMRSDSSGLRFTVKQSGPDVTISASIRLMFKDNGEQLKWQAGINRYWNKGSFARGSFSYGNCTVSFNITVKTSGDADNYVYSWPGERSWVAGLGSQDGPTGIGFWSRNADGWVAAHETGHFLGLVDDYYFFNPTQPKPNHADHMMAQVGGTVRQHEIDDIMKRVVCGC